MYVENASRAMGGGFITVDNLEPNPKNPIIAEPRFVEGDIFKIIVPLDDDYSYDYVIKNEEINSKKVPIKKYWKKM